MIIALAVSLVAVAAFAVAIWRSRIILVSREAIASAFTGLSAMVDSELDDTAKEVAVRAAAFTLLKAALSIALRFAFVLAAAAFPILLTDFVGFVSADIVMGLMLRLDFIVVASLLAIILGVVYRKLRPAAEADGTDPDRYSPSEQFIHAMAFSSPRVQTAASWLEDRLISETSVTPSAPPIFVTSIARGGTTALLNALHDIPGVATHTYRDMPFISAPRLWDRLSGGNKRQVARKPRAHGDGLEIDLDTPEAFEEIFWKLFWPEKYRADGIRMWGSADRKPEADHFIARHMTKIVAARLASGKTDGAGQAVYCSKNNANIARISYLTESFPGCRIVVPVRRPESHAASLMRQHNNFLKLQADEPFVQRYMRDIGHFEFGLIHKPLMFPGFQIGNYDPSSPDYWLDYWLHAFRYVRKNDAKCILVLQDDLRSNPVETMSSLCLALKLDIGLLDLSSYFRSGADQTQTDCYDPALLKEATALYGELQDLSHRQLNQFQLGNDASRVNSAVEQP